VVRSRGDFLLRLPRGVLPVFDERLEESFPLRAERVRNAIKETRGGRMNDPRFESRMRGSGPRYEGIDRLFEMHGIRLGLRAAMTSALKEPTTFERQAKPG
jgi:DNA repair photolyase